MTLRAEDGERWGGICLKGASGGGRGRAEANTYIQASHFTGFPGGQRGFLKRSETVLVPVFQEYVCKESQCDGESDSGIGAGGTLQTRARGAP